jgi:ABC-type Na+ transport system ATPase subunit NatA
MIEGRNLHKSFGSTVAVRDISFTARHGQITGLLGENGARKTTTLALVCGLHQADAGAIQVGSDDATPIERRRRVGALLDHKGLYDRLTARENIAYFGRLHGMARGTLSTRTDAVLSELGLERIANRRTAGFSQSERMKVRWGARSFTRRVTCSWTNRRTGSIFRPFTASVTCSAACGTKVAASSFPATCSRRFARSVTTW